MEIIIVNLAFRAYQIGPFLVIEEELAVALIEPEPDEVRR